MKSRNPKLKTKTISGKKNIYKLCVCSENAVSLYLRKTSKFKQMFIFFLKSF